MQISDMQIVLGDLCDGVIQTPKGLKNHYIRCYRERRNLSVQQSKLSTEENNKRKKLRLRKGETKQI